jgi:hypothetical protein
VSQPEQTAIEDVRARVDAVFERLQAGQLQEPGQDPQSGWEMSLPDGRVVVRSVLDAQAQPLITLGAAAVPSLLRWARNDNLALRYVALHALEQITGERPTIPYFAPGDADGQLTQALGVWWRWYEAQ